MKVIKRDGRAVDFDRSKIEIAIEKANKEVRPNERATKEEIKNIIQYVVDLDRKRILVEDIQDIIEQQLMDLKHFELAKKYMIYRYTRALVRKANSTDQSILGLIKNPNRDVAEENSNRNAVIVSNQRDLIAGEVSKDLTKRILLPEKISKAHEDGIIHFHDAGYFLQPIFNNCIINIGDMLDNGTVMNGKLIETPKSFQVACNVITQIIASVASSQYGGQTVDISHLGKYLRKSYNKFIDELNKNFKKDISKDIIERLAKVRLQNELVSGVQTILYQINTLMTTKGEAPFVSIFLHLDDSDEYLEENAKIIEEIINQKFVGIKNEEGEFVSPEFPKLVYVLDENNNLSGGKFDYITELAIKCNEAHSALSYMSSKIMKKNYQGNVFPPMGLNSFLCPWKGKDGIYKFDGRFNQGIVSINLPQIAIIADGNEKVFFEDLDEKLKICYEALMCKHYALLGTMADVSPIHWKYGAIARLKEGEKIDEYLKNSYSTLSLGFVGLYEAVYAMKNVSIKEQEGHDFAIKILKRMKEKVDLWKKETGIGFMLCSNVSKALCYRFARIDRELYGTIKNVTDKERYTCSYHLNSEEDVELFEMLKYEAECQQISTGGAMAKIDTSKYECDLKELIKYIYENVQYVEIK